MRDVAVRVPLAIAFIVQSGAIFADRPKRSSAVASLVGFGVWPVAFLLDWVAPADSGF